MTFASLFVGGFLAAFLAACWFIRRLTAEADAERHEVADAPAVRSITR